ncbi:hypothetical protein BDW22DRAFT_1361751 [Trametopsis cervina]|nr:hypothetical protein BDW22DRAFT_1361751 [Trametopsis cervina]
MSEPTAPPSPTLADILALLDVNNTFGALLVGGFVIGILYGVTTVQTYNYFEDSRNRNDGKLINNAVLILWLIDTLDTAFSAHFAYYYNVLWVVDPTILTKIIWSGAAHVMLGGIGDIIVTGLFCYRIWKFGGKKWPLILIIPPAVISFISFEVMGILALIITDIKESQEKELWLWEMSYGLKTCSDVCVMISLCFFLFKHRTGGFRSTTSIVNRLIFYTINTCILTTSSALGNLVLYTLLPNSFWWMVLTGISPKLMMNSLLALLNSRTSLRRRVREEPVSIHLSPLESRHAPSTTIHSSMGRVDEVDKEKDMVIHINSEVIRDDSPA